MSHVFLHDIAEQPTPRMLEHDRRMAMWREEPLLALAFWVEAAADRRIEQDVCAISVLADIRDRARTLIEQHTKKEFYNALYPMARRDKAVRGSARLGTARLGSAWQGSNTNGRDE